MESLSVLARRTAQRSRSHAKPLSPLSQSSVVVRRQRLCSPRHISSSLPSSPSSSLRHSALPCRFRHHDHKPTIPARFSSSSSSSSLPPSPSSSTPSTSVPTVPSSTETPPTDVDLTPAYRLTFTCKPCSTRSTHRVTKQGYHHGTVLITCPHCKNRHLIADHLKIFLDKPSTLEDILASKTAAVNGKPLSSLLKRGKLGIRQGQLVGNEGEEDIEFWEDGTETVGQVDRGVASSTEENK